jgi:hypothetical protein
MSIFISIASYQDPFLENTILNAYEHALQPEQIVFGIVDQSLSPLIIEKFEFKDQIRYLHIHPKNSKGACWARTKVQTFFDDEKFFLQIDSHTIFNSGWDARLVNDIEKISAQSEKYE